MTGHLAGLLWHLADYGAYGVAVGSYFVTFGTIAIVAWRVMRAMGGHHADHY